MKKKSIYQQTQSRESPVSDIAENVMLRLGSAPFVRSKQLLQVQHYKLHSGTLRFKYEGLYDVFQTTVDQEGFSSLWRGSLFQVLQLLKILFQYFLIKIIFAFVEDELFREALIYVSRGLATVFAYPFEVFAIRLATDTMPYLFNGPFDVISYSYNNYYGIWGFFSGFAVSLVEIFVYRFVYQMIIDIGAGKFAIFARKLKPFEIFIFEWVAVFLAGWASLPFNTIKLEVILSGTISPFVAFNIWKKRGVYGYFEGALVYFWIGLIQSVITMLVLYTIKKSNNRYNRKDTYYDR